MIQTKDKFEILADSGLASAKFSLKEENLAHVFNILRSNLYSDKILAVIREYSTNAYDANIEAGNDDKPIEVTLPSIFDPTFKIRDNGPGLSEYDVFNVFSSYGASTRRDTNEAVGMLGMGSKSGFAYASSFSITSFHNGKKAVYEAYIDESDIGTITKIYEEDFDGPSGVEIALSVNKEDISEFSKKATAFYTWFTPAPIFHGNKINPERNKDEYEIVKECDDYVLYKYGGYSRYSDEVGTVNVYMGNILYPVDNKYILEIGANFSQIVMSL